MVGQPADIHLVLDGELRHRPWASDKFLNQSNPERIRKRFELLDGLVPDVVSVLRHG
jgi:hypothetical protein